MADGDSSSDSSSASSSSSRSTRSSRRSAQSSGRSSVSDRSVEARYEDASARIHRRLRAEQQAARRSTLFSFGVYRRRVLHAPYGNVGVLVSRSPSEASAASRASSAVSSGSDICLLQ